MFLGTPDIVTTPGICDGDFTRTKTTVISDQCGNETTIIQTLVVEDNVAPIWLSEPDQFVVTDDLDAGGFEIPVAQDDYSIFKLI